LPEERHEAKEDREIAEIRPPAGCLMLLAAIICAGGALQSHVSGSGGMQIELWQAINLVGAPLLAVLFAQPVIEDLAAWFGSRPK
jgi:hypothetical protein